MTINKLKIIVTAIVLLTGLGIATASFAYPGWFNRPAPTQTATSEVTAVLPSESPEEVAPSEAENPSEVSEKAPTDSDKSAGETQPATPVKTAKQKSSVSEKDKTKTTVKNNESSKTRTQTVASRGTSSRGFIWPVTGRISSQYGQRNGRLHKGIDIAVPVGTKVKATKVGTVIYSGWVSGYGNTIMVDHGNGLVTLYGHNSKLLVTWGDKVKQGQAVALSGNTGRSTGPHLHFEIQVNGKAVNPKPYLP